MIEKISDYYLFKRIVELGTLSAAAGDVGLSPGSASLRLAAMERNLGVQLFRRTTRQLHLTEAGELFLESAIRVLDEISDYEDLISKNSGEISGKITITAPVDLGRNYIVQAIDVFLEANPKITVKLICTDSVTDMTERDIDIAIRYGALRDSSLRLRRISSNRRIPVASPEFIKKHGKPSHPRDLTKFDCLLLSSLGNRSNSWIFIEHDKALTVRVSGARESNDGDVVRKWAIDGRGIALKSAWDVAEDINGGRLVPLLVDYCPPNTDLQLVFPPHPRRTHRVRLLSEHLVRQLKKLDNCLGQVNLHPHFKGN